MTSSRHSWGDPQRFLHKTERACLNGCGIVKVTRHEGDQHWVEFWRDCERIDVGGKTPICDRVGQTSPASAHVESPSTDGPDAAAVNPRSARNSQALA